MGRPPKNQSASHLHGTRPITSYFSSNSDSNSSSHVLSGARTRLIDSYFTSGSRPKAQPLSPQPHPGPFSSQDTEQESTSTGTVISESIPSSDTMESDSVESSTAEPLRNPFSSQDLGNWDNGGGDNDLDSLDDNPFSPTKASIIAEAESVQEEDVREEEEPLTKNTDTISELEPINGLGLMTFSSQLSGESLRRLALSPRKQKRKKELSPGMMPSMPTLTFSEKLAAEMGEIGGGEGSLFGLIRKAKPLTLGKVAVVDGSDSGSEADWNDDEVVATLTSKKTEEQKMREESPTLILDSDDDYPNIHKFSSNKAPMMLEESDSDLEDNPFSSHNSIASSPTPLTISTSDKSEEDINVDLELSEDDKLDEDQALAKQRVTRSCTHAVTPPRSGRTLRSATLKPAPTLASLPKGAIKPARAKAVLFSLDSLLKEKKRKEKIGYDIEAANSMMTLDDELLEEYDEDDDEEALFGTEMIPKGVLSEEQEGVLTDIIEDEQNQTVEDIAEFFVHWPLELVVQPLEQELCDKDLDDHIVQKVLKATQTEMQRNQFLTSPFLMIMSSSPWTMPRSLFRWLVHVVAVEQNTAVTLSLFALLQRVLSQKSGVLGVDHQDLIRAFRMYGAKDEYLDPDWKVTPVTRETQNERLILPETAKFPRQSLKAVVKLVTMTATLDPQFYNVAEIRKIVNLLMRMTTDPIIGDVKSLLGSTIVALLDAIPADDWEVERHCLCDEIIQTLGTSMPFILLALRQLPSLSMRVALLRRGIALSYLGLPPIPAGEVAPDLEELHRALFVDKGFLVNSTTNYKDLGRRIQIFGFCLDDEQMIASYGRIALEPLLKKLRMMHGRIVDVRAAFMERTLTKDMIQRLYIRLYYAGIHRQTAIQTTINFDNAALTRSGAGDSAAISVQDLRLTSGLTSPS